MAHPGTRPLVGPVIGFALTLEGRSRPGVWVTGDTVLYGGLRRAATGLEPEVAVVHIGAVKFPITGPLAYTMDAAAAVELIELASPGVVVPVHVEGWSHFSEQEEAAPASSTQRPRRCAIGSAGCRSAKRPRSADPQTAPFALRVRSDARR